MKTKTFEEFSENKTPKIVIYNSLMEYTETYEIDSNIEEFEENYLEYLFILANLVRILIFCPEIGGYDEI